ncbi:MAG: threonine synthase, partial [Rhizobiales bacterium]|nr:threonine synthase [Hyphomicrobiales bacterium]
MQTSRPSGSYVSHLECSRSGDRVEHDQLHGLSASGAPLLVCYDLDRMKADLDRDLICRRMADMWMWREFLPLDAETQPVTLGEAITPLIPAGGGIMIKDEGRLPTGSFKARGMAVAVSMARHFGKTELAVPTAGNAGAAAAAYGAAANMNVHVFTPEDTPKVTVQEIGLHGADIYQVPGLIDACGKVVRAITATETGWHDLSTLAEPYRLEGKKTMGLELAFQFGWSLPDVIYYPTGGGTGFIGMWKAFQELRHLGWIDDKLPRMVSVQTHGCNP